MSNLSKKVLKETMKSFMIRKDSKGKPLHTVGNFGLEINGISIRTRGGEYKGFSMQAMEYIKPLLTNKKISRTLDLLKEENLQGAISVLNIDTEVKKYGLDVIYFILSVWLKKNAFIVPEEISQKAINITNIDNKLLKWITAVAHDPIIDKIKIIGIGQSKKGHSVVPEAWLGREFASGDALHKEMDKLDWRKGKPPVNFCCVYSLDIVDVYTWGTSVKSIIDLSCVYGFKIDDNLKGTCVEFKGKDAYTAWIKVNAGSDFLPGNVTIRGKMIKLIFSVNKNLIIDSNPIHSSIENVGVLVSKLQKAIRRGKSCPNLLIDSIKGLANAAPYNLPDQQFIRVSGCRQLLWRLFITIIEDAKPFVRDNDACLDMLDMLDIFVLALLCQIDPNIVLKENVIKKIIKTALAVQFDDKDTWNWREGTTNKPIYSNSLSRTAQALSMGTMSMPMMKNDLKMLTKGFNYLDHIELNNLNLSSIALYKKNSDKDREKAAALAAYDMHCLPRIILYIQGSLPFVPCNKIYSTKHIPGYIWTESSRINTRIDEKVSTDPEIITLTNIIKEIQTFYYNKGKNHLKKSDLDEYVKEKRHNRRHKDDTITKLVSRTGFLLLFGEKFRLTDSKNKTYEIIVGGTPESPCKIKKSSKTKNEYIEGEVQKEIQKLYFASIKAGFNITVPPPPLGYKWIFKKNNIQLKGDIKSNKGGKTSFIFKVDGVEIEPFNASSLLTRIPKIKGLNPGNNLPLIKKVLYITPIEKDYFVLNRILREVSMYKKIKMDHRVFKWDNIGKNVSGEVWKDILVKIYNNYNKVIQIGPVDRKGQKVDESISYMREGILWRMFNFLAYLYPNTVSISGHLKFKIKQTTPEYRHMIETLTRLSFRKAKKIDKDNKTKITIKAVLWDHQKNTSDRITYGLIKEGRKGFGDASHVGAGKTLTALTVSKNIINHNIDKKETSFRGIVVLLPTTKLYPTWINEIKKHTKGFSVIIQLANGTLSTYGNKKMLSKDIKYDTLVISTLGRMRDHPLSIPWQLVVIDECLSVQNRDALQTEEAWRQVICSQFGVIMMSATFFRSRFDKMFYMLKMLRSGLPEKKEFLDTILSECMVCFIPEKTRNWTTNTTKYPLSPTLAKAYKDIKKQNMSAEKLYQALSSFLYSKWEFVPIFEKRLKELDAKRKVLIYARSKKEADNISIKIPTVSRYPNKTKTHVVVSYAEGTYGLNDLVEYDTILTRPPEPDKLLQMKGRLDRHGQKSEHLYLEYILTENTIEEAWLIRMEIANHFYKNHIMPLAEFYDIAIGKKTVNIEGGYNN